MSGYAIIKSGGKQYRVKAGDIIDVELLDSEESAVEFNEVLFLFNGKESKFGAPMVANALVRGEVLGLVRGPKVFAYKYKKRKNYRKKTGHRQNYARVKITQI